MDLIPITHLKISKDKWLNKKIKYEEELRVEDILDEMCQKSYDWILSKGDLDIICDYDIQTSKNIEIEDIEDINI